MTPWLSADEIEDMCKPLTQPAAQIRFIERTFGIKVERKPDGSPLVFRSQLEAKPAENVLPLQKTGQARQNRPDRQALLLHLKKSA